MERDQTRPNLAIVITDGASNVNPHLTVPEALKVHNAGITVLAVGISSNISIPELMGIASDPDEDNMFTLDSYVDLIKREQEISTRACQTIPGQCQITGNEKQAGKVLYHGQINIIVIYFLLYISDI